jgi:5-oxopent-3-ene-1,2,5-tricarboxylate decarboxylase / 2-hydroxyhepta-2,4-diene-1,7-dioate isomerase
MNTLPYLPVGTVYGTLLNFQREHALWAPRMNEAPYKAPPQAPVLYVKTANTFTPSGHAIALPGRVSEVDVSAALGLVAGEGGEVVGCVLLNDVAMPHESNYRPPVKYRNVDGFLGVGGPVVPIDTLGGLEALGHLSLTLKVDGVVRQTVSLADLVRDAATLWADVNGFQSMRAGDVLMLGTDCLPDGLRPRASVGDAVEISAPGFSALVNHFVQAEPQAAAVPLTSKPRAAASSVMRRARVAWAGAVHDAIERDGRLELLTPAFKGRLVGFDEVTWLPPLAPVSRARTVLALGLNYADHAKELAFKAPEEPLAFVKGEASLIGHRAFTVRPEGVAFMHYECELAVVIGRVARHVKKADALAYVGGYTVANDYAIRDYLENWYRPNLKVKNRDTCTPIGPWLVDAADVHERLGGPMNLALKTTVNGRVTQQGSTRDMIFDVPSLIEYFSGFMTLMPGDLILTGTPDGVVDCQPGDVIVTEIEGIGALMNTITSA